MKTIEIIRRNAAAASREFAEKTELFVKAIAENPAYAIKWDGQAIVRLQTRHEFWTKVAVVAGSRGVEEAVASAEEMIADKVREFFGASSTCGYSSAIARTTAETFSDMREQVAYLRETLNNNG